MNLIGSSTYLRSACCMDSWWHVTFKAIDSGATSALQEVSNRLIDRIAFADRRQHFCKDLIKAFLGGALLVMAVGFFTLEEIQEQVRTGIASSMATWKQVLRLAGKSCLKPVGKVVLHSLRKLARKPRKRE